MADQKDWAKIWFATLSDEDILALSPADRWAWIALIVYTKKHGTNGTVMIRPQSDFLAVAMGIPTSEILNTIARLPHVFLGDAKSEHGTLPCSFINWYKYQIDSTHAERQKRARSKRREEERRREEKRKEEIRITSPYPSSTEGQVADGILFDQFWQAYPRKNAKVTAQRAFGRLKPTEPLLALMLADIQRRRQSQDWTKQKGQYIPHPATYLNQRRWEDETHGTNRGANQETPGKVRSGGGTDYGAAFGAKMPIVRKD